jgi:hypothetical protein
LEGYWEGYARGLREMEIGRMEEREKKSVKKWEFKNE